MRDPYVLLLGDGPLVAAALHAGHDLREAVRERLLLPEGTRVLEEDPYTELLCGGADGTVVAYRSRFEVDLNRPRDKAVYRTPEDAWGLELWAGEPDAALVEESLRLYDRFYRDVEVYLGSLIDRFRKVVVLDLHSYCHRRAGPGAPPADPATHPDVNLGTGTLPEDPWRPLVDRFMTDLRRYGAPEESLRVGENIRFRGGYFSQWVHARFPRRAAVLAIEFKKVFMDEWTGRVDPSALARTAAALRAALPGLREELEKL
ncbi:MAG: N-formylglutamate amidohydrolase [Deferrisomatales bacterium]